MIRGLNKLEGRNTPNKAAEVVKGFSEKTSRSRLTDWLCFRAELNRVFYFM